MNLARLDLVSIRLMVLCAQEGSLSRAASATHLSISSASHRLAALEHSLRCKLFDRHSRGLTVTAEGESVLAEAEVLLEAAQRFLGCRRAAANADGDTQLNDRSTR